MNSQAPTAQMLIQVSHIPVPMQANHQPNEALPADPQLIAEVARLARETTATKNELLAQRLITDGFADTVHNQTVQLDSFEQAHTTQLALIEHQLAQLIRRRESTPTAQVARLEKVTAQLVTTVQVQAKQIDKLEHTLKLLPERLMMKLEIKEREQGFTEGESSTMMEGCD